MPEPKFKFHTEFASLGFRRVVVGLFAVIFGLVGTKQLSGSQASGNQGAARLQILSTSAVVAKDDTLTLAVQVDAGGEQINSVQATVQFPSDKLQYQGSVDACSPPFNVKAPVVATETSVVILCASYGPQLGMHQLATLKFKALTSSGSAKLQLGSDSYAIRAADTTNVLGKRTDAEVRFASKR